MTPLEFCLHPEGIKPGHFLCIACCDIAPTNQMVQGESHAFCIDCVRPLFIAALRNEINHPVQCGFTTLSIDSVRTFFDDKFLSAYDLKLQEYALPVVDRLYCNHVAAATREVCGHFIGSKDAANSRFVRCSSCSTFNHPVHICTECRNSFSGPTDDHSCGTTTDPLEGLKQGVDYQLCPNPSCKTKMERSSGCNHMQCDVCATEFCYVCAGPVEDEHYHLADGTFVDAHAPGPFGPPLRPPIPLHDLPLWQQIEQRIAEHRDRLAELDLAAFNDAPFAWDLHQLVTGLSDELVVYNAVWDNPEIELDTFLKDHQWAHDQIVEHAQRVPDEVWNEIPGLASVYLTYLHAWNGEFDRARRP